ncbi:hypothetical protein OS190_12215 [Sulfitobacter sp. F26204]|nr:hypothetical protein [Sulfitobacter sp. F26204]
MLRRPSVPLAQKVNCEDKKRWSPTQVLAARELDKANSLSAASQSGTG